MIDRPLTNLEFIIARALGMDALEETTYRADLTIDEVNWQRVVDNWNLPVKITKDGRNPYRMGDAKRQQEARREKGLPEKEDWGHFFGTKDKTARGGAQ